MFIAWIPRIRQIVKICDVDRFFSSKSTMDIRVILRKFLAIPRSPFFVHLSIVVKLYTALQKESSMLLNSHIFHTSGGISSSLAAFLFLIFLRTESSSSCVNCPSLMSCWLLIIFVIGSSVTFGGFPSKFSKCYFHRCVRSSWLAAFILALAVLFLLLTLPSVMLSKIVYLQPSL